MTDLAEFMSRITQILDTAGAPYMLVGSIASAFHGMPRSTQDVDIVVDLDVNTLEAVLGLLPEECYYVSADAAKDAVRRRGQFNVIDLASGWKADLIVKKSRPFSEQEFERRIRVTLLGIDVWLTSAEDSIISKLEWARLSGASERQLRDVSGILDRAQSLDVDYIERWVSHLALSDLWAAVTSDEV